MDSVKTLNYSVFVTRLEEGMGFYAAYHRDPRNKATHFIGVPLIMLAILVPLSWIPIAQVSGFDRHGRDAAQRLGPRLLLRARCTARARDDARHRGAALARRADRGEAAGARLERLRRALRRRLDPAACRPRFRRPQAGARRQLLPDFRRADLPRRRGVFRSRLQARGASRRAATGERAQLIRAHSERSSIIRIRTSSRSAASGSRSRYSVRSFSAGCQHSSRW